MTQIEHSGSGASATDILDDETRREQMQQTFDKMVQIQHETQMFSMNTNMVKAAHDSKMESIRNTKG